MAIRRVGLVAVLALFMGAAPAYGQLPPLDDVLDPVEDVLDPVVDGVTDPVDDVTDPADDVVDGVIEPLPDLPVDLPDVDDPGLPTDPGGVLGPSDTAIPPALEALVGGLPTSSGGGTGQSGSETVKPVNTSQPALSGGPRVGQTLTCTRGAWANNPTVYYAAWLRGQKLINGQNGLSYTIQKADVGSLLACSIIAGNNVGYGTAVSRTIMAQAQNDARPVVSRFKASPKKFKLRKGKTVLKWRLSEAAAVTIVIERKASGRYTRIGSISKRGKKGAGKVKFKGKVANRYVKPGRYRFTITAEDAAGNVSKKRRASLRLRG